MNAPRCARPLVAYETTGRAIPDKYSGYGSVILRARRALGMTQETLAEAIGSCSRKAVSAWENESRYPRSVAALERVLGIQLGAARCGRPEGHPGPCRSEASLARMSRCEPAPVRSAGWPVSREEAA